MVWLEAAEPFLMGVFGGVLGQFLGLFDLRHTAPKDWPFWLKLRSYWLLTGGMILMGGLLVIIHQRSGATFAGNAFLALNIGASAPLVMKQVIAGVVGAPGPRDPSQVN
jgi:hypothetical protein